MEPSIQDPETARLAALSALRAWAVRRDRLAEDRGALMATAWRAGTRTVAELARVGDVSRDTVYADLKSHGIDPTDRRAPASWPPPRYEPARYADVRDLADAAAAVLRNAMLADNPPPLVQAAWQAHIALCRVADLLDPQPPANTDRTAQADDLAARGDHIRHYAHHLLAAEHTAADLATHVENRRADVLGTQAVIDGAQLTVHLPTGETITVALETGGGRLVPPGWTTWRSDSPHLAGTIDAYAHLELQAALDSLAEVVTAALDPAAFDDRTRG